METDDFYDTVLHQIPGKISLGRGGVLLDGRRFISEEDAYRILASFASMVSEEQCAKRDAEKMRLTLLREWGNGGLISAIRMFRGKFGYRLLVSKNAVEAVISGKE